MKLTFIHEIPAETFLYIKIKKLLKRLVKNTFYNKFNEIEYIKFKLTFIERIL